MEPFWLIAICALAASIGSLLALRPGDGERSTLFFLLITAGLAGFPVFALGHSLGWWGHVPDGGWAASPQLKVLPGEKRQELTAKDCIDGASLVDRVGPQGQVQQCLRDGQRHGPHRAWRHDGVLALDCTWKAGQLDGPCARWYLRPGRDLVVNLHRGHWTAGRRDGLHVDRFRTGRLHYEAFFLGGIPRGRVVVRGPAGQTIARLQFDADGPTGRWLRWHRRTANVLSDGHFRLGKPEGRWKLTDGETGRLWLEANFRAGSLDGRYLEWNPWGAIILEAAYVNGQLHGPYHLRHDHGGASWIKGTLDGGRPVGLWTVWDRMGRQLRQCDFDKQAGEVGDWCAGRGPWIGRQEPVDLLLERQADWYRIAVGQTLAQSLDAYEFDYGFPDWSPL